MQRKPGPPRALQFQEWTGPEQNIPGPVIISIFLLFFKWSLISVNYSISRLGDTSVLQFLVVFLLLPSPQLPIKELDRPEHVLPLILSPQKASNLPFILSHVNDIIGHCIDANQRLQIVDDHVKQSWGIQIYSIAHFQHHVVFFSHSLNNECV